MFSAQQSISETLKGSFPTRVLIIPRGKFLISLIFCCKNRGAEQADISSGNQIIQRLRDANQAIAVPTLPAAGQSAASATDKPHGDEANASKAGKEEGKRDSSEKAQGLVSTGNSSNHNPGSPPTDPAPLSATPAATRHTPSTHATPFDPKKAIKEAMDKV